MTLNNRGIFNYIEIKENKYFLKQNVPDKIIDQIKDMIYDFEKAYHQKIKIIGLN